MSSTNKIQRNSICGNITKYFQQYCEATSIHGFKYFGEKRSIFERIWWAIIFIICLSGCSFLIYTIYEKYEKSPVIVTFATKETSIYKIPFPAVTICPETKSNKEKFNYQQVMQKKIHEIPLNVKENQQLNYMSFLCDDHNLDIINFSVSNSDNILEIMNEIKPNFLDFTYNCTFMGMDVECKKILIPIITDEGVCYSFNILDRRQIFNDLVKEHIIIRLHSAAFSSHYNGYHQTKEHFETWNFEKGYINGTKLDVYPRRALLAGASNGLTIYLATQKQNLDYSCKEVQGYRVLLHAPMRMPRLKQEYFRIPLDQAVVAAVHPVMINTSEAVKSYDIRKRDCCFPSERKLKFFRAYSQLNCQLECLTNFTLRSCDCVNFFMPRDNETKICGLEKKDCIKHAESILQIEGLYGKFEDSPKMPKERSADCDCLPLCTDLSYHSETSQTSWDWSERIQLRSSLNLDKDLIHLSSLTVYFKFNHFITSERNELYGPTDFLANFGGLLGLFTGFSILSLMEIIYFLSVRICCNMRIYGTWIGIINQ